MSAIIPDPGSCIWTYHPPDATHPAGYWTVVDTCKNGKHCSTVTDNAILMDPVRFAAEARKEYADRKKTMTKAQEAALDEHLKAKAVQAVQTFPMPCV